MNGRTAQAVRAGVGCRKLKPRHQPGRSRHQLCITYVAGSCRAELTNRGDHPRLRVIIQMINTYSETCEKMTITPSIIATEVVSPVSVSWNRGGFLRAWLSSSAAGGYSAETTPVMDSRRKWKISPGGQNYWREPASGRSPLSLARFHPAAVNLAGFAGCNRPYREIRPMIILRVAVCSHV